MKRAEALGISLISNHSSHTTVHRDYVDRSETIDKMGGQVGSCMEEHTLRSPNKVSGLEGGGGQKWGIVTISRLHTVILEMFATTLFH